MADSTSDKSRLVATTANQLRLIQTDFADESAEVRHGYLAEVIQGALSQIPPEQRDPFLDELRERFPTWDEHREVDRARKEGDEVSPTDQREWQDISFVLERLIELAQPLSSPQKQNLIQRLQEEGLSHSSDVHWPQKTVRRLQNWLQLEPDQPIDPQRVLELLIHLSEFSDSLDQLAWGIWKNISPKARLKPNAPLKQTMQQFLVGQSDVPMSRNIDELRHLIASLISATAQIGRQFSQVHLTRFSPAEIEANVRLEKVGPFESIMTAFGVRCWEKYKELANELDDVVIEREIMQIIARFVDSMRGR